jgi:hypothetical protein
MWGMDAKTMRGHSAYLLRNSGTETECLFESSLSVPLFWLALIDTRVIRRLGEEIKRLFMRSSRRILSKSRTSIKLPREYMLKNGERGREFFLKFHPALLDLYGEFLSYLSGVFLEGDVLELDIIEITSFNSTVGFLNQVKDVVRSIQLKEDPDRYFAMFGPGRDPLSLAGDDRRFRNQFRECSLSFASCCDREEREGRKRSGVPGKIKALLGGFLRGRRLLFRN